MDSLRLPDAAVENLKSIILSYVLSKTCNIPLKFNE